MRFQIYKKGKLDTSFTLSGAYMFGTDGVGVRRAKITTAKGVVECRKSNLETAGLALLWPIEGFGRQLMPTTCLPERKRSYNLNVEIARGKLMQVATKREDWLLFEGFGQLDDLADEAQSLFIKALQHIDDGPKASLYADEALKKAVALAESLSLDHAAGAFETRRKSHGFTRSCLGCRLDSARIGDARYIERLTDIFGYVTVPINWSTIEKEKGEFDFSAVDACIEALGRRRIVIGAGPLLRFSKEYLPAWLIDSKLSFEKVREMAYHFVSKVVARYANIVRVWYAVSGLNLFNHFGFSFEHVLEMTRAATIAVRSINSRAIKIIELCNPWGEYYSVVPGSIPPLVYIDMVVQSGINFDAFGLQMRFGRNQLGMHVRDMMQVSAVLDYFSHIAKPVYITDVEVPSESGDGAFDEQLAGSWHEGWDQLKQQLWIEQFYRIALSKQFVDSVTYSNLVDRPDSVIANSGLTTAAIEPKRSYKALKKLHGTMLGR